MSSNLFKVELRRRKEKTFLDITEEELMTKPEQILQIYKKECVDLKNWFFTIVLILLKLSYTTTQKMNFPFFKNSLMNLLKLTRHQILSIKKLNYYLLLFLIFLL